MKRITLGVASLAFAMTAAAQTTVGNPSVVVNGTKILLQFPVSVTVDVGGATAVVDGGSGTSSTGTGTSTNTGSTGSTGSSSGSSSASSGSASSGSSSDATGSTGTVGITGISPVAMITGINGALNGFQPAVIPDIYKDISTAAVDPFTTPFMNTYGPNKLLADFSIPYTVVNGATKVDFSKITYADESDIMPVPMNTSTTIENGIQGCNADGKDHHGIIVDSATGFDYEVYQATYCNGKWSADSITLWDLTKDQKRPVGWTSSDAAGLPVFPLLVRYDEVAAGSINHALRVTMNHTVTGPKGSIFVAPATHGAGDVWGNGAYMGMRMRLKANFDISGFSAANQTILKAMKKYGMIVADNGSSGFFQGTADSRWNTDDLAKLRSVPLSAFEIVQMGPQTTADTAPTGAVPVVSSFSGTQSGNSTVLMWSTSGESYNYIAEVGPVRGSSVTVPYEKNATYTLVSTNQFGRTTKTVKVK